MCLFISRLQTLMPRFGTTGDENNRFPPFEGCVGGCPSGWDPGHPRSPRLAAPSKGDFQRRTHMEETLEERVARLEAENQALKTKRTGQLSLKVSEKGGLSVYGLGRFPVTLYKEQWAKLLGFAEEIQRFLKENDHLLKTKE